MIPSEAMWAEALGREDALHKGVALLHMLASGYYFRFAREEITDEAIRLIGIGSHYTRDGWAR